LYYLFFEPANRTAAMTEQNQVQLKKGALELCVLALLARGESYAYEIASALAAGVGMGEGTIYPLMRRMQDDRLVETRLAESNSGPPRKYYRLTPAGRAAFAAQKREWRTFTDAVNQLLGER
jgi:PadR family transcriptional regulator PadR